MIPTQKSIKQFLARKIQPRGVIVDKKLLLSDDEPACNHTGICKPYEDDEDDPNIGISNCRFCGSELHLVNGVWKNWDWDLHT